MLPSSTSILIPITPFCVKRWRSLRVCRKERLFPGAGADELIDLVLRATITPGDVVINCPPSFGMYPFSADVNAAQLIEVPRRADFSLDVPAIEAAVRSNPRAKVLFVCSPNNPDGSRHL